GILHGTVTDDDLSKLPGLVAAQVRQIATVDFQGYEELLRAWEASNAYHQWGLELHTLQVLRGLLDQAEAKEKEARRQALQRTIQAPAGAAALGMLPAVLVQSTQTMAELHGSWSPAFLVLGLGSTGLAVASVVVAVLLGKRASAAWRNHRSVRTEANRIR